MKIRVRLSRRGINRSYVLLFLGVLFLLSIVFVFLTSADLGNFSEIVLAFLIGFLMVMYVEFLTLWDWGQDYSSVPKDNHLRFYNPNLLFLFQIVFILSFTPIFAGISWAETAALVWPLCMGSFFAVYLPRAIRHLKFFHRGESALINFFCFVEDANLEHGESSRDRAITSEGRIFLLRSVNLCFFCCIAGAFLALSGLVMPGLAFDVLPMRVE